MTMKPKALTLILNALSTAIEHAHFPNQTDLESS